jgi:hypothetical protein
MKGISGSEERKKGERGLQIEEEENEGRNRHVVAQQDVGVAQVEENALHRKATILDRQIVHPFSCAVFEEHCAR